MRKVLEKYLLIIGEQAISILCQQNIKINYPTNNGHNKLPTKMKYVLVAENELGDIIGFTSASKRDSNPSPFQLCRNALSFRKLSQKGIGKQLLKEIQKNYQTKFVEVLAIE